MQKITGSQQKKLFFLRFPHAFSDDFRHVLVYHPTVMAI